MNIRRVAYAVAAFGLMTGAAVAQDKADKAEKKAADLEKNADTAKNTGKEPDMKAMMAAYEKASAPTEHHKMLQKSVGKWSLSMKSYMAPGQPPVESKGTAEAKSLLGDRYIQTSIHSTFMGKPFNGIGTNGYDNATKKFVGTWIDSMSTGILRSEGTADPTGKVITAQAVGNDPLTGKENHMRIVQKWENNDRFVEEFYEDRGGKEVKSMEITYTRVK